MKPKKQEKKDKELTVNSPPKKTIKQRISKKKTEIPILNKEESKDFSNTLITLELTEEEKVIKEQEAKRRHTLSEAAANFIRVKDDYYKIARHFHKKELIFKYRIFVLGTQNRYSMISSKKTK